jgi:hypothetical protein
MNAKALKTLRSAARRSLKSSKLKGPFEREEYMRKTGVSLGASHKQVKRSIRVVSEQFGQKPPEWARARRFARELVLKANPLLGIPRDVYRNVGFQPV